MNNVFPSRSLYGVSLWRSKVLTGSVPFAFSEAPFRPWDLSVLSCMSSPFSFSFPFFLFLFLFAFLLEYVCEHNRHKLCSGFSDLFICGSNECFYLKGEIFLHVHIVFQECTIN